jgi:hypothetical protein
MRIVLTKKFAECIDDVPLREYRVGDLLDLPDRDARLLVAEGWAIADRRLWHGPPPHLERRRTQSLRGDGGRDRAPHEETGSRRGASTRPPAATPPAAHRRLLARLPTR